MIMLANNPHASPTGPRSENPTNNKNSSSSSQRNRSASKPKRKYSKNGCRECKRRKMKVCVLSLYPYWVMILEHCDFEFHSISANFSKGLPKASLICSVLFYYFKFDYVHKHLTNLFHLVRRNKALLLAMLQIRQTLCLWKRQRT